MSPVRVAHCATRQPLTQVRWADAQQKVGIMETKVLSVMIYEALNAKGAVLGNASIGIIESAIDEYEAAQPSVQAAKLCPHCNLPLIEGACPGLWELRESLRR